MPNAKKFIWVTFQKEGIHAYPAAASDANLKDVAFLASPHRHMFHFRVWLEVFHDDRDVEFILFKRWLEQLYTPFVPGTSVTYGTEGPLKLDNQSCEMLAEALYEQIRRKYPNRDVGIEISEDGENGCLMQVAA